MGIFTQIRAHWSPPDDNKHIHNISYGSIKPSRSNGSLASISDYAPLSTIHHSTLFGSKKSSKRPQISHPTLAQASTSAVSNRIFRPLLIQQNQRDLPPPPVPIKMGKQGRKLQKPRSCGNLAFGLKPIPRSTSLAQIQEPMKEKVCLNQPVKVTSIRKCPSTPQIRRKPPPSLGTEYQKLLNESDQMRHNKSNKEKEERIVITDCTENNLDILGSDQSDEGPPQLPMIEVSTPFGTTFTLNNTPQEPLIVRLSPQRPSGSTLSPSSLFIAFRVQRGSSSKSSIKGDKHRGWKEPEGWDQKNFKPLPPVPPLPAYLKPLQLKGGPRLRKTHQRTISS
ncbi:hypothetical protein L204_103702 [Cryptococcus depauperatus]|nr:hypothetical protein L204_02018 [Cryptococcus depauperatus CBS 7855]